MLCLFSGKKLVTNITRSSSHKEEGIIVNETGINKKLKVLNIELLDKWKISL